MVALVVDTFGGEFPSLAARNLPPTGAQTALDLLATSPEFRPVLDHTTATNVGVNNPKTLYRLQRTPTGAFNDNFASGWIANAGEVNYVKGQLNDDLTERTYYTIGDGSEPPRVLTATGEDRRLGVPAPTTAPTAEVTEVDEFTQDDVEGLPEAVVKAVLDNLVPGYLGPTDPTENYYKAFKPVLYRVYQTDGANGRIVNAYTGTPEQYAWVTDPALNGQSIIDGGIPYYALSVTAYASWYTVNTTGLRAALEAIEAPSVDGTPPVKYLTTTQIDGLIAGAVDGLSATTPAVAAPLGRLRDGVAKLRDLLDNRQVILSQASLAAFYASAEVVQEVNAEFSVFAKNVHSSAVAIAAAGITTTVTPGVDGAPDTTTVVKPTINATFYGSGTTPNEAGAVAAMTANFNSNFVAGSDGIKRLKVGAVTEFLYDGLKAVASQLPEPSRSEQLGRLQSFDVQSYAAALAARIGPERWRGRPDWPEIDAGAQAAAFKSLRADVEAEVRTLEDYAKAVAEGTAVRNNIANFRIEQNLDANLPPTTTRIVDTRFYIATYVTDWDEESQISPVSDLLEVDQNDTVVVTIPGPPAGRHINRWRLYRSNVGSQTAAFQFVDEGPINSLTYSDTKKNAELQEVCPSITWAEPPANLQGLVGMPNGIMAGFFGNTVCFCEPFVPYAWPVDYQITTEHPIVGLGVFGQTLVAVTRGHPYLISGSDSASMSGLKMESNHAGVSRRSIVSTQAGVVYAGADGLCLANQNGVNVVTGGYWLREDWIALNPSSIFAVEHEGVYVFRLANGKTYALGDGKLVELVLPGSAFYVDRVTDTLYVAEGTAVRAAFSAAGRRTARWRSKKITLTQQQPLAWWKVYSDFAAPVTVRWYGDGVLCHTATFNDLEPQRLPPGRWLEHEVEIESTARVTKVVLASTTQELQSA